MGQSLFLYLIEGSSAYIRNVNMNNYSGNFIDTANPTIISISSSVFKNLDLIEVTPFIRVNGTGVGKTYSHSVMDTIFQNISLKTSLILAQNGLMKITMSNLTITDIKKKEVINKSIEYLNFETEWSGLCFLGKNDISLTIKQSKISNLNSHCISLKFSTMTLTSVIFDNSELKHKTTEVSEDLIDETHGVSWINFHAGTSAVSPSGSISISLCKFINNQITPKYGGVSS